MKPILYGTSDRTDTTACALLSKQFDQKRTTKKHMR